MEFKSGRPSALTDEVKARVLEALPKLLANNQIASFCRIEPSTLRKWLYHGKKDLQEGNNETIYAQFFLDFYEKKADSARELISTMLWHKDKFKVNTWLLERTFKQDYGPPNDDQRKFYELVAKKLAKVGIKMDDYDSFMEEMELNGD